MKKLAESYDIEVDSIRIRASWSKHPSLVGIEEYPVILEMGRGKEILVCSSCGHPVATGLFPFKKGTRSSWYCLVCEKFLKGGSTDTVRWVLTKPREGERND